MKITGDAGMKININFKINLIKKTLNNRIFYFLAGLGNNILIKGYMKETVDYLLKETRAAYLQEKPVVWCSTFIPPEIIYACGGVPFMPEVAAGFSSTLGLADRIISTAEGEWMSPDLCSIHRCGTGLMRSELLPEPDYVVAASHLCDGAKKYLQYIAGICNVPYYLLETPYSRENADWLADQIRDLVLILNDGEPDFTETFTYSNRAHRYHQEINELRKYRPAVFSGERALNLVPMEFMSFGSRGGKEFYKRLLEEIKGRIRENKAVVDKEKFRLLWLHLKPYYPQNIFSELASRGAVIAFEEYSQLYWELLDSKAPYYSLALKMIDHFGWGRLDEQIARLKKIVSDYDIDGVVAFSHRGCRQSSGRMDMIRLRFKREGIPFLNIDGDLVDARDYREGQLLTRLQAFIELLEFQRGDLGC